MKRIKLILSGIATFLLLLNPVIFAFADETVNPVDNAPVTTANTSPSNTNENLVAPPVVVAPTEQNANQNVEQNENQNTGLGVNQNVTVGNSDTGSDSNNDASLNAESDQSGNFTNNADADNNINTSANTGYNNASDNTGNGSISTGDSNQSLNLLNILNSTFVTQNGEISLLLKDVNGDAKGDYIFDPKTFQAYTLTGAPLGPVYNSETGSGSDNGATLNGSNNLIITGTNDATLDNALNINGNTGNNTASDNTGNGSIATGDTSVAVNLFNFLNSSIFAKNGGAFGILNIFGNWAGNLLVPKNMLGNLNGQGGVSVGNTNTGSDSINKALGTIENVLDINNDNVAEIDNALNVTANTGYNKANDNTLGGSITSGDIDSKLNVTNEANKSIVGDSVLVTVVNVFGKWVGSNLISPLLSKISSMPFITIVNQKTGSGSENDASLTENNAQIFTNLNMANIKNVLNIFDNTGNNTASDNTGTGNIKTGDVNILGNIVNFANLNVVANKFIFLGINIFGDWFGNIDVEKDKPQPKKVIAIPTKIEGVIRDAAGGNFDLTPAREGILFAASNPDDPTSNTTSPGPKNISAAAVKTLADRSFNAQQDLNPVVSFIMSNLNTILVVLLTIYLSILSVYFGRKRLRDKK